MIVRDVKSFMAQKGQCTLSEISHELHADRTMVEQVLRLLIDRNLVSVEDLELPCSGCSGCGGSCFVPDTRLYVYTPKSA